MIRFICTQTIMFLRVGTPLSDLMKMGRRLKQPLQHKKGGKVNPSILSGPLKRFMAVGLLVVSPQFAAAESLTDIKARIRASMSSTSPIVTIGEVEDKHPPLTIYLSDVKPCAAGDRFEREALPKFAVNGYKYGKHYRIVRSDEHDCPSFDYKGQSFAIEGYNSWPEFRRELWEISGFRLDTPEGPDYNRSAGRVRAVPAPSYAHAPFGIVLNPGETLYSVDGRLVQQAQAQPQFQQNYAASNYDSRPGHWSYPGDLASHLQRTHGINTAGMSRQQMLNLHDALHEGTAGAIGASGPVQRVVAPLRRMFRPFQRMLGAGRCPAGGC